MVADLKGFMDALGIESAVLVGHSLGAIFIQDFAAAYPERVSGLVLSNAQARNKPPIGMNETFRKRIDAFGDAETNREIFRTSTPRYFRQGALSESELAQLVEINVKSATPALQQSFEHLLTAEALSAAAWARIDMPTLIVATTHDIVPFITAVGLLDSLPDSRIRLIESGHTPMWEKPNDFAAVLREFLSNL